jgi:hypothetical protein
VQVGSGDGVRVERAVGRIGRLGAAWVSDRAVDDEMRHMEMRHMNAFGHQLAG